MTIHTALDPVLLDKLVNNINSVACIYNKAPETFVRVKIDPDRVYEDEEIMEDEDDNYDNNDYYTSTGEQVQNEPQIRCTVK